MNNLKLMLLYKNDIKSNLIDKFIILSKIYFWTNFI